MKNELERSRSRGNLIEAYKIIAGKESVGKWKRFFELSPTRQLGGHMYKLLKKPWNIRAEILQRKICGFVEYFG